MIPQEREMDVRKQALEEERRRREELEKRLQEETNRRQKLIEREVKLREKQRAQVRKKKICQQEERFVMLFHPEDGFDFSVTFLLRINLQLFLTRHSVMFR